MRQRSLGILGGALLIGGIVLGVATGVAAGRNGIGDFADFRAPASHVTAPVHPGGQQPRPRFGLPGRHGNHWPGPLFPAPNNPSPSPSG